MKPFAQHQLSHDKEVFNYQPPGARNSVECSFGRITQMWRLLLRQINVQPNAATDIVILTSVAYFIIDNEPNRLKKEDGAHCDNRYDGRKKEQKMLDGLTKWLNAGRVTQALTATMDRDVWKDMVANATKSRALDDDDATNEPKQS
ncbi:hypothetical protein PoB_005417000 [Plakobranchus ocellatus]|uniref:DDE Tnp4 domain-containing protein n=1 Tax=Plakobranchus ocellatus TaxID=259542 RepID=A0AAV4C7K7_9GAST|nr:hypothetical protein PoB_005417000 [Plakobranchus ocellatus]